MTASVQEAATVMGMEATVEGEAMVAEEDSEVEVEVLVDREGVEASEVVVEEEDLEPDGNEECTGFVVFKRGVAG